MNVEKNIHQTHHHSRPQSAKANRLVDEDVLLFLEGRLKEIFYMQKIETRAGPALQQQIHVCT